MRSESVDRVCCLLAGSEAELVADDYDLYGETFGEANVKHVPSSEFQLVDVDALESEVLPFLAESVAAEQRVVVHGLAGLGRTGQVLAAWLVSRRGYRPHEALDTVREMGRDTAGAVERADGSRHELLKRLSRLDRTVTVE